MRMINTIKNVAGFLIMCFLCIAVLSGIDNMFKRDKVYLEELKGIYHKSPYCEAIEDMEDIDRELMSESGEIWGSSEVSSREAYNDITLDMCEFCFSKMDIKHRKDHMIKVFGSESAIRKERIKREKEKEDEFLRSYGLK